MYKILDIHILKSLSKRFAERCREVTIVMKYLITAYLRTRGLVPQPGLVITLVLIMYTSHKATSFNMTSTDYKNYDSDRAAIDIHAT